MTGALLSASRSDQSEYHKCSVIHGEKGRKRAQAPRSQHAELSHSPQIRGPEESRAGHSLDPGQDFQMTLTHRTGAIVQTDTLALKRGEFKRGTS